MLRNLSLFLLSGCIAAGSIRAQQNQSPSAAAVPAPAGSSVASSPSEPAEDWTKLAVDRTVLKPLIPGSTLGKADTPEFTREIIRLQWRHGDFIDIYVLKPHGVAKPRVVLYLYSYPSDSDRFRNDRWAIRATRGGVAAVGFVSALTGERFRNRPMKEWFVSELEESLGSSVHDVQLILDYLASRGDLSLDQVGMWGQGSGGSIAILSAAADPRIKVIDVLNPWGDWPDWFKASPVLTDKERPSFVSDDFLKKVSTLDPVTYLPQLKDRSLRVQQILDDPDTPTAAKDKIAAALPADELVRYPDVPAHLAAWRVSGLSGWLAAHLRPAPPAAATAASSQGSH
jgi:hypothetical protein